MMSSELLQELPAFIPFKFIKCIKKIDGVYFHELMKYFSISFWLDDNCQAEPTQPLLTPL